MQLLSNCKTILDANIAVIMKQSGPLVGQHQCKTMTSVSEKKFKDQTIRMIINIHIINSISKSHDKLLYQVPIKIKVIKLTHIECKQSESTKYSYSSASKTNDTAKEALCQVTYPFQSLPEKKWMNTSTGIHLGRQVHVCPGFN